MSDATKNAMAGWLRHYAFGLFTQSFNGAITGLAGIGIMGEQGKLPEGVTWHVLLHTFAVAYGIHALIYFKTHPLPEHIPDTSTPTPIPQP